MAPIDRRQFLRGAGCLALAAGWGGVLATLDGCAPKRHPVQAPTTTAPGAPPVATTETTGTTAAQRSTAAAVDWSPLAATLTGKLVLPTDAAYPSARREYNARFDAVAPMAVAYCQTSADVARCLAFAREHRVRPVPRSGGHSFAGWSTGTGLVVDVSALNAVVVNQATGSVTVGAGTKLIDLYTTLANAGLGLAGGSCPTVGIAGLTLGGGMGVIDRKYGLTCDALTSLDLVSADSRTLTANPGANTDLWWASRGGGGGSFAIATSFTFAAHPVGPVSLFTLEWPWSAAGPVVQAWQSWGIAAPMELWSNCQLLATNGGGLPRMRVTGVYLGTAAALSNQLAPLTKAIGTAPTYRFVGDEAYLHAMLIEAGCSGDSVPQCHVATRGTAGVLTRAAFAAKSDFYVTAVPETGIEAMVSSVQGRQDMPVPGGGAIVFDLTGGAINQVAAGDSAFVHRNTNFLVQYSANWVIGAPAAVADPNAAWVRQAWSSLRPYASGQAYQNYADPDLADWQQAYYGANFARLTRIKAAYDPDDVFHFPQSIPLP